ncbi:MAG: helix-turn-helix transcriptional regulator [Odoribacter sp.]|nr:helix-turn-helix transcriptional regulator [Odoribacter sp.]
MQTCYSACRVIDKFGDKWSLLILLKLDENGIMRFNELKKSIPNISQRMLSISLKSLEELGLISRTLYPEIPPKVEYQLTELGEGLMIHIHNLVDWIKEHINLC